MAETNPVDLLHGILLGYGLQQLPKVLQALQKTQGAGQGMGMAQGTGQGAGVPGLENIDPEQILPLLMPLLSGQGMPQGTQAGPVPGVARPPAPGGTAPMPPPYLPPAPPPTMGRIPTVPRVLPMSAGAPY